MELIFCCVKERNDLMVNIIKEDYIEESIKELLGDIFEYNSVVNEFFLPMIKSKISNTKEKQKKKLKTNKPNEKELNKHILMAHLLQKNMIKKLSMQMKLLLNLINKYQNKNK